MNGKRREYASACAKSNSLMPGVCNSICTSSESGPDENTRPSMRPSSTAMASTTEPVPWVRRLAPTMAKDEIIIVNLSGRGDKDFMTVAALDGLEMKL